MFVAPAIGIRHALIDRVMVLVDQSDEPAIVDVAFGGREHAALAQGFEHVVELGERQVDMLNEHALAQGIKCFGFGAETNLQRL